MDTLDSARLSRRTLLKGAGAAGMGLTLAQAGLLQMGTAAAASTESIQDILNVSVTIEMFGVTFLAAGLDSNKKGNFNPAWPDPVVAIVTAARAQEQFHLDFFKSLGGQALTDTFTIPDPKLLTDMKMFFNAVQEEETREIAAQIAAFNTFTAMNRPDLVKTSFQYAAEEAEHRVLANYAAGARPANNLGFAPALYNTAGELIAAVKQLGFVGGSGMAVTYPGPGSIDASNVIERTPGGPAVSCAPGMPNTGGGGMAAQGGGGSRELLEVLGLFGFGVAAVGALSRLRNPQREARSDASGDQE